MEKKIFSTVDNYQDHLKLYNRVWIDETYIEDYQVLESDNNEKHSRGLSKTKICIVVAIDSSKNCWQSFAVKGNQVPKEYIQL